MRTVLATLSSVLVALTACGGAVEPSPPGPERDTTTSVKAPSALGLWVAPTLDPPGYLPLDLCADGTVSYDFPVDPAGVRERCAAVGGSHRVEGTHVSFVVGRVHLEAALEDGKLVLAQPGGPRTYYRTSPATDLSGTYALRDVMSHGGSAGDVTLERHFSFARGRFTFDNVLSGETTGDRWSTVEQGSYAMSGAGDAVFTTDGEASHAEHVVVFGARGEYLHIGRVGYMARATQD